MEILNITQVKGLWLRKGLKFICHQFVISSRFQQGVAMQLVIEHLDSRLLQGDNISGLAS